MQIVIFVAACLGYLLTILPECAIAKQTNPSLKCFGSLPSENVGWPPGRSPNDYGGNEDLCSSLGVRDDADNSRNLGCSCPSPYGTLNCQESEADTLLWNAQLIADGSLFTSFVEHCQFYCECNTPDLNTRRAAYEAALEGTQRAGRATNRDATPQIARAVDEITNAAQAGQADNWWQPDDAEIQEVCGASCNSASDCFSSSCECQAKSSTINIATGDFTFYSSCGLIVPAAGLSLNGKRNEPDPCVCNATYVSHGCCGTGGMIWEAPELKLGELEHGDRSL